MNYGDEDVRYTRVHEFRHLHPERRHGARTVIFREYSRWAGKDDEPFYPVATAEDRVVYNSYRARAQERGVIFGGRLGSYRYLDMHQAIGAGLMAWRKQLAPHYCTLANRGQSRVGIGNGEISLTPADGDAA
jgi:UDP-galactopyranose mutase